MKRDIRFILAPLAAFLAGHALQDTALDPLADTMGLLGLPALFLGLFYVLLKRAVICPACGCQITSLWGKGKLPREARCPRCGTAVKNRPHF